MAALAVAAAAPIVMGIASGIAAGMATKAQNEKLARQYKESAEQVREAAKKYSGRNADAAMRAAGNQEARTLGRLGSETRTPNTSNLSIQNALNASDATNQATVSGAQSGQALGRGLKAQELNSLYNKETAAAKRDLKQAGVDYQAGQQALQGAFNTAGGIADLYKDIRSDERAKEYNNHSNLPKADVDDAFRQIESIEYKYKPGMGPQDGKHVGTTAQSWEGTAFDDAVKENPEGIKELDKNKILEAAVAGVASLRKDIDDMKGNIKSGEECKEEYNNKSKTATPGRFLDNTLSNAFNSLDDESVKGKF